MGKNSRGPWATTNQQRAMYEDRAVSKKMMRPWADADS